MAYLLDTNSLIDGYKKWYYFPSFKPLWNRLAKDKSVYMGPLVYAELIRGKDSVSEWTRKHYKGKLITLNSPKIIECYKKVMNYIKSSTRWSNIGASLWDDPRKADPWLIAVAYYNGWTIVTLDGGNKITPPPVGVESNQEPKINAVAWHFHVNTIPMYKLIIQLGIKWKE